MLLSDYLRLRNQPITVTTGKPVVGEAAKTDKNPPVNENGHTFAEALSQKLEERGGVSFSAHAIRRMSSRSIDITKDDQLDRLNKGVEIAAGKGSQETLVLVDENAYVVSVKNNKVITTLTQADLKGNIFTNIDSTVII